MVIMSTWIHIVFFILVVVELFRFFSFGGALPSIKGGGGWLKKSYDSYGEKEGLKTPREREENLDTFVKGEKGVQQRSENEEAMLRDMEAIEEAEIKENEHIVEQLKAVVGVLNKYLKIPEEKFYVYIPNLSQHIPRVTQYLEGILRENDKVEVKTHNLQRQLSAIEAEVKREIATTRRERIKEGKNLTEDEERRIRRDRKEERLKRRYSGAEEGLIKSVLEHNDNFKQKVGEAIRILDGGSKQTLVARATKAAFTFAHRYIKTAIGTLNEAIKGKEEEIRLLEKLQRTEKKEGRKIGRGQRQRGRAPVRVRRELLKPVIRGR